MFLSKKVAILFLKNTSLDLFTDKGAEKDTLTLPKDLVKNLNIKDKDEFKQLVLDFFARNSLKNQKVLLILSEDVIVQKTLELLDQDKKKKEEEEFIKEIKVEEEKQIRMVLADDKNTYFLATSEELIDSLNEVLNDVGSQLIMVVPVSLFDHLSKKNEITSLEAQKILENIKALKFGDFLTQGEEVMQKPAITEAQKGPQKHGGEEDSVSSEDSSVQSVVVKEKLFTLNFFILQFTIVIATALLVFAGLISGALEIKFDKLQSFLTFSSPTPTPTVTPTPTEVPISTVLKEELKIQVLNGTGTPGQAGTVRDVLKEAEFKNIEVADAEEQSGDRDAEVVFSQKVSSDEQKEIKKILEDTFASVSAKADKELKDFDVLITTGR